MQMQFARFGRNGGQSPFQFGDAIPTDVAIGQILGLAESAGIRCDVQEGRLVLVSAKAGERLLPTISRCLAQIGTEAVIEYFTRNPPERRVALSATA